MNGCYRQLGVVFMVVILTLAGGFPAGRVGAQSAGSQRRSLKEKAQSSGTNVVIRKKIELKLIYDDLHTLAVPSAAVVRGVPIGVKSWLSKNERDIATDYQFRVKETFKGNFAKGSIITVRLPGGVIDFGNGATAEVRSGPGDGHRLYLEKEYVLYLRSKPNGTFTFTGGPQGAFLLTPHGVQSNDQDRDTDPVVQKYNGMNVNPFLRLVNQSVF